MDLTKYLTVLVVLCLEGGETGGGGGKHHDHVKLHIPEFHHHDHHKKVITIHHHHHKPKKEQHHHHHHHHHKPQIPHHHFSHHHKKVHLKTETVAKGGGHHHGSHGHHGHHHKHHGHHHSHHGHHGHHGHHDYDAPIIPSYGYSPNAVPSYENDYPSSYSPSIPSYDGGIPSRGFTVPQAPHVHGISHTVKQVKVYDSLPGVLPNTGVPHGYEVTEEGDDDEDSFLTVNNLQSAYPSTYGYLRGAASEPTNNPFGGITSQGSVAQTHDPFAAAPEPTSLSGGIESFTGSVHNDPFSSSAPTQGVALSSASPSAEYPTSFQETGFDGQGNSFTGSDLEGPSFIADENTISDETPVSFSRESGIQQSTKTGNVETVVY